MEKKLSYNEFLEFEFENNNEYSLIITYKNIEFDFFIKAKNTNKAIIFGTGAVDRKIQLPYYARYGWNNDFEYTTIYYGDPTLYMHDDVKLAWCYGTNDHWYLSSIAFLLKTISQKLNIVLEESLFFGSSGGGYTSISLAVLLHSKCATINPQLNILNYYKSTIDKLKEISLQKEESFLPYRISIIELIKKEKYFPPINIMQNINCKNDITNQINNYLVELSESNLFLPNNQLNITFYYNEEGHNGMPTKEETIQYINNCITNKQN